MLSLATTLGRPVPREAPSGLGGEGGWRQGSGPSTELFGPGNTQDCFGKSSLGNFQGRPSAHALALRVSLQVLKWEGSSVWDSQFHLQTDLASSTFHPYKGRS